MVPATMTSSLLGSIRTLLELPGSNIRGRNGGMMAALLMTLWATMDVKNMAFKSAAQLFCSQELVSRNQGAFFTNKLCEEVNTRVDTLVQRRVQTEHVTPEMAAAVTRQAIVDDKEDPGFFQELGKIMKRALLPVVIGVMGTVGGMVVKAAAARLAGCSVM